MGHPDRAVMSNPRFVREPGRFGQWDAVSGCSSVEGYTGASPDTVGLRVEPFSMAHPGTVTFCPLRLYPIHCALQQFQLPTISRNQCNPAAPSTIPRCHTAHAESRACPHPSDSAWTYFLSSSSGSKAVWPSNIIKISWFNNHNSERHQGE